MKPLLRQLLASAVGLMALALVAPVRSAAAQAAAVAEAKTCRAGFAERDITPAIGAEQPGGYGKSFNRSIHDPCKVRAAVFVGGGNQVAIVGIDALFIRRPSVAAARKQIHDRCGIPEGNVMIAASHSHSAGPMGMILPGEYDHADELVRKLAYEMSSTADAEYLRKVETAIADAVCDAHEHRVAALRGRVRNRQRSGFQPPLPDEERAFGHASSGRKSRGRRAGRAGRSASRSAQRLG